MRALGLLVRVGLDVSPVRGDDDEPRMAAVILQPLDELVFGFGVVIIIARMCYLRIEHCHEFSGAESLPASFAHASDVIRALLGGLANRVQSVLSVIALDPNLMSKGASNRRELLWVGRAMLFVTFEIPLRR
jgi:hypothetical protein